MKTPAAVRFNYPTLIAIFVLAIAAFAVPLQSASSGSVVLTRRSNDTKSNVDAKTSLFARWGNLSPWDTVGPMFAVPVAETIATYASDCTTPKTTFLLGETVCAKTDLVDTGYSGGRWVHWLAPGLVIESGSSSTTLITANPQTFSHAPLVTGTYKVTIAETGDISQTPAIFTVTQPSSLETFATGCTTSMVDFNLGDGVCVTATDLEFDASRVMRRIELINPGGYRVDSVDVAPGSNSKTHPFTLPSDTTSLFADAAGNISVDNRGVWLVNVTDTDGGVRQSTSITVRSPATLVSDLQISKVYSGTSNATAGATLQAVIWVQNNGPDSAQTVQFVDVPPSNTTFQSIVKTAGLNFSCTTPTVGTSGTITCTRASLGKEDFAGFVITYLVDTGVGNVTLTASASISSATTDRNAADNSSSATAAVTNPAPPACTLTCPNNITVGSSSVNSQGQAGAVVTFADATTSGTCGTITSTPVSGSFFAVGSSVVTQVTSSGQECSFTVIVEDDDNPTITCPANITVNETSTGAGAAVSYTGLSAADNGGPPVITCMEGVDERPSDSTFALGTHTIICKATDANANESPSCSFNVIVNAATTCALTPPANVTVNSASNACGANVTYADPTTASCTSGTTISCDRASGSLFPVGDTVVTCTSSPDGATTSFTVTVNDVTGPAPDVATLPTITAECTATAGIPTTVIIRDVFGNPIGTQIVSELPKATDSCSGSTNGSIEVGINNQRTFDEPGTYTVQWTYTDARGNTTTQPQTVIVTAPSGGALNITGAPVVSIHNLAGSTSCVMVIDDLTSILNTSVSGTCGATEITRAITPAPGDGNDFTVGTTYTVVSTVTEGSNTDSVTQTFKIIDDTPPVVVTVPANATYQCVSEVPAANASDATATDNCVAPTKTVADTNNGGAGSPSSPLIITRTFTATDVTSGLTHSMAQTITVIDNTAPTLNAPNIEVSNDPGSCAAVVNFTGLNASDNCGGTVNINTTIASGTSFPKGTTTVTATATDAAGNQTVQNFTVKVNDTEFPTITYPTAGVTAYLPLNSTDTSMAVSYSVTAADNCAGVILDVVPASGSVFPVGATTVTATATDASGNVTTRQFTVTVLYNFTGFFSPVNNLPTLNVVNAGKAIPVKFSLSGDKGLNIFAANSPYTVSINCDGSAPQTDLEETVNAGGSSLSYSPDIYNYVWKTENSWKNTCRQLVVKLNDGSEHTALFKFK